MASVCVWIIGTCLRSRLDQQQVASDLFAYYYKKLVGHATIIEGKSLPKYDVAGIHAK